MGGTFKSCIVSSAIRPLLGTPRRSDLRLESFAGTAAASDRFTSHVYTDKFGHAKGKAEAFALLSVDQYSSYLA